MADPTPTTTPPIPETQQAPKQDAYDDFFGGSFDPVSETPVLDASPEEPETAPITDTVPDEPISEEAHEPEDIEAPLPDLEPMPEETDDTLLPSPDEEEESIPEQTPVSIPSTEENRGKTVEER